MAILLHQEGLLTLIKYATDIQEDINEITASRDRTATTLPHSQSIGLRTQLSVVSESLAIGKSNTSGKFYFNLLTNLVHFFCIWPCVVFLSTYCFCSNNFSTVPSYVSRGLPLLGIIFASQIFFTSTSNNYA